MSVTPFISNPRHPTLPTEGCDSCENIAKRVKVLEDCCEEVQEELEGKQDTLIAGSNITIENNVISATGGGSGTSNVLVATREAWDSQRDLIGEAGTVYVYSDGRTNENGDPVPTFKVGNGINYLIDMAFNDDIMVRHMTNDTIHVTQAEKDCWNNKVTCFINAEDLEDLVFTKDCI